ncbi:MAG: zf-HC2 domain-containing protein [Acidobacteriaceae bacterium]|nr:zf-HC2 domain-containing protein [Acidobacteriaceae bacterium]
MSSFDCVRFQSEFSPYLDGAVSGEQMLEIARHLEVCASCREEFDAMRQLQRSLAMLGPAKAPDDLATRLRVAISHQKAATMEHWLSSLSVRWENTFRPLLLQVSAGVAGSVALIGGIVLLLGMVAEPQTVMANDEPLGAMTSPHYLYSAATPRAIVTDSGEVIVVEADIDEHGRVYDYHIVSGPADETVRSQIIDQLLMSVYEPARVFGAPARGRVLLTFSGISVEG